MTFPHSMAMGEIFILFLKQSAYYLGLPKCFCYCEHKHWKRTITWFSTHRCRL